MKPRSLRSTKKTSLPPVLPGEPAGPATANTPTLQPRLITFRPELVAGAADKNVFQSGLADRDGVNLAGEGFNHIGNEAMAILALQANSSLENLHFHMVALAHALCQGFGVAGVKQDHVAADLTFQLQGRSQRHQRTFVQDGEAVATFTFLHQMGGDDHSDPLLLA